MYAVSDLMTQDVISVEADEPLAVAQLLWSRYHLQHLPVMDGGRPVGVLSRAEALAALKRADENEIVVRDLMVMQSEQVRPGTPLRHAATLMLKHQIRSLAVMDEGGQLVGVLTDEDLLRFALELVTDLDRMADGLRRDASHEEEAVAG
jgi:tRNA nucleotidyltransferase (CCA-adding enzyme)